MLKATSAFIVNLSKTVSAIVSLWATFFGLIAYFGVAGFDYSEMFTSYKEHIFNVTLVLGTSILIVLTMLHTQSRSERRIVGLVEYHRTASDEKHANTAEALDHINDSISKLTVDTVESLVERYHHHNIHKAKVSPEVKRDGHKLKSRLKDCGLNSYLVERVDAILNKPETE